MAAPKTKTAPATKGKVKKKSNESFIVFRLKLMIIFLNIIRF